MQIKKIDGPTGTTGAEESKKSESPSKPKTSKGIAESESKFETPRSNPLFSSSRSSTRTATITDGTSNTIVVGEQSPPPKAPQPHDQNHQQPNLTTIGDGSSRTVSVGVSDGTSNTIVVGEQTPQPPSIELSSQGQKTPVTTKDGSQIGNGSESQQPGVVTIGDCSSNTIVPQEDSTESQSNVSDGSSNTIIVGEQSPESSSLELSGQGQKTPVTTKDGSEVGTGSEAPEGSTVTINDGTSNTITFGE